MSVYPGALDSYVAKTDGLTQIIYAAHVNALQEAVVAIETELGTDPAGSEATVKNRIYAIEYKYKSFEISLGTWIMDINGDMHTPRLPDATSHPKLSNDNVQWIVGDNWITFRIPFLMPYDYHSFLRIKLRIENPMTIAANINASLNEFDGGNLAITGAALQWLQWDLADFVGLTPSAEDTMMLDISLRTAITDILIVRRCNFIYKQQIVSS